MHDLSILLCRYFGVFCIVWAIACAIIGSIQPITVLANRGHYSARSRRGARRTLIIVAFVTVLALVLGVALVWVSFYAV